MKSLFFGISSDKSKNGYERMINLLATDFSSTRGRRIWRSI